MSLFEQREFAAFAGGLPHSFIVFQWGDASVAKVGTEDASKIFAILSDWSSEAPAISFKCSPMSYEMLPALAGIRPAPYLARAKWVQVQPGSELDAEAVGAYIVEAHRLAFATLPRKLRDRLSPSNPVA